MRFKTLLADEAGISSIEYSLLASLIALAIMSAVRAVGNEVTSDFSTVATTVSNATSA